MIKPTQPMTGRPVARSIAVALAVVTLAALTACASPSSPSSVVTHPPVAHPTSPVHAQPVAPTPPGHVTCAALASLSAVQAAVTSTATVVAPYTDSGLYEGEGPNLSAMDVSQAGGLNCLWQDPQQQFTLQVEVLPNAAAAIATAEPYLAQIDDGTGILHISGVPVYGDQSWTHCLNYDDPSYGECDFEIRVGNYWISISEENQNLGDPYPPAPAEVALINGIVAEVRGLPSRPTTWRPPAESFSLPTTCSGVIPLDTLNSDLGESGLTLDPPADPGQGYSIDDAAAAAVGALDCSWSGSGGASASFDLVPGSAWAWTAAAGPAGAAADGYSPVAGIGTAAWEKCSSETDPVINDCDALIMVGHSWFEAYSDTNGPLAQPAMTTLVRDIVHAMGFSS
jgi:hypothetical protein